MKAGFEVHLRMHGVKQSIHHILHDYRIQPKQWYLSVNDNVHILALNEKTYMFNGGEEKIKHGEHVDDQVGFETANTPNIMVAINHHNNDMTIPYIQDTFMQEMTKHPHKTNTRRMRSNIRLRYVVEFFRPCFLTTRIISYLSRKVLQ